MTILDTFSSERAGSARAHDAAASKTRSRWGAWPEWSTVAAALWSLGYACLGIWWMTGHSGFPFGGGPPPGLAASSLLDGVRAETGAPVVAALGFIATAAAIAMRRVRSGDWR